MRHVQKIAYGQDTTVAYNAVLRQQGIFVEGKAELRAKTSEGSFSNLFAFDMLPQMRPFVFGVMARLEGEQLGAVWLQKIERGEEWKLETDLADSLAVVGINVHPGANMLCLEKEGYMLAQGDVWWLDGAETVFTNNSDEELLLLFVRLTPNAPAVL